MPQFTNQAQLSYNNLVVNSNTAVGNLVEVLSATKTAVLDTYRVGENVTYVISIINSGTTGLFGVTVTDDLGAYSYGATTLYPLNYSADSVRFYINGILQPTPAVAPGPPLVFSGLNIPAGGNAIIIYEAMANEYAPQGPMASVTNTAVLTGAGLSSPVRASQTVRTSTEPDLTITKSMEPTTVTENGTLTYTFVIQNYGNSEADMGDNVSIRDTFNPLLENITVSLDGNILSPGVDYTYSDVTGVFSTSAGRITVPAATYSQDSGTGIWTITPGVSTLTVSGTV